MTGYKCLVAVMAVLCVAACTPLEGSWPWARPTPTPAAVPPETRYEKIGPDVIAVPVPPVQRETLPR